MNKKEKKRQGKNLEEKIGYIPRGSDNRNKSIKKTKAMRWKRKKEELRRRKIGRGSTASGEL